MGCWRLMWLLWQAQQLITKCNSKISKYYNYETWFQGFSFIGSKFIKTYLLKILNTYIYMSHHLCLEKYQLIFDWYWSSVLKNENFDSRFNASYLNQYLNMLVLVSIQLGFKMPQKALTQIWSKKLSSPKNKNYKRKSQRPYPLTPHF